MRQTTHLFQRLVPNLGGFIPHRGVSESPTVKTYIWISRGSGTKIGISIRTLRSITGFMAIFIMSLPTRPGDRRCHRRHPARPQSASRYPDGRDRHQPVVSDAAALVVGASDRLSERNAGNVVRCSQHRLVGNSSKSVQAPLPHWKLKVRVLTFAARA